jgi:hypothetical protein
MTSYGAGGNGGVEGVFDEMVGAAEAWFDAVLNAFVEPSDLTLGVTGSKGCRSDVFTLPQGTNTSGPLEVVGDLHAGIFRGQSDETIPSAAVRFDPPNVSPDHPTFRMVISESALKGKRGATYWGHAAVGSSAGGGGPATPPASLPVWIVIP